ncbi:MAG: hypothetical protein M1825_004258 [Sarcosagium campestre]|nr:MAG: hypothetical protein M1825_004258 [Sarcosagium campestre]
MTLEDFEKSLAENRAAERPKDRNQEGEGGHRSRRQHHHRSSRKHDRSDKDATDSHRHGHKRRRRSDSDGQAIDNRSKERHKSSRYDHPGDTKAEHATEKGNSSTFLAPEGKHASVRRDRLQRDSWMEAPSALDVDYTQRGSKKKPDTARDLSSRPDYDLKIHERELNHHLEDLANGKDLESIDTKPAQQKFDYVFGDQGSKWRMTKLKAVYTQSEETGKDVDEIALERFGSLEDFDAAREEQTEMDRRQTYGKGYVGKEKPTGELYKERMKEIMKQPENISSAEREVSAALPITEVPAPSTKTMQLDQTALNRLKAQMMKAKLKGSSNFTELESQYNTAIASFANNKEPDIIVLGAMNNRMLAGGRRGEVKEVENRRGRERGLVEENEDMTIEDMVRQERRTKGQAGGDGQRFAERIAKDAKFDNDLDYLDENAAKLAKRVQSSEMNLKNMAISDFQKMNRILDQCPLCHHEDTDTPPVAPVVSLATRVYLTLPTEPEISDGGACIVPIQHRVNLLECDDDEWEEIRNFMKSLTRMYHDQGRDVVFYENAAAPHRKRHASMEEAILSADEEWTQHKKLIDTLSLSRTQNLGKLAFRRSLVKEMPYFHVWFELDGGLGHIVEDANRWPRGDLFARETLGGMLDVPPDVVRRQGKWRRGKDTRMDDFIKRWGKFDWTRVLTDS